MGGKYIDTLDTVTRNRYQAKLKLIDGEDPYETPKKDWNPDPGKLYQNCLSRHRELLCFTKSAYSLSDLKDYITRSQHPLSLPPIPAPSSDEQAALLKGLHERGNRPVILSLMPGYADAYVPKQPNRAFPQLLSELRDENSF